MATAKNLDVFISYAHSEVGLARDLGRRLSLAGVTSFVAADDVQIGDNLNDRLEQALQEADVVVVLCSGASSKSQWVKSEIALAVERGLRGDAAVIPVYLDQDAREHADTSLQRFSGLDYDVSVGPLADALAEAVSRVRGAQRNRLSARWDVPSPGHIVVPTQDIEAVVRAADDCRSRGTSVLQIVGVAGVGKTTAAAELVRSDHGYEQQLWIPAAGRLRENLQELASELGVAAENAERPLSDFRSALMASSVLVVLDELVSNDDARLLVASLRPSDLLVATARSFDARLGGHAVELRGMSESEIEEFLAHWRRAATSSRSNLGQRHPSTLSTEANLAAVLGLTGRLDEAVAVLERLAVDSTAVFGDTHPSTLAARSNLANAYWALGRNERAAEVLATALAGASTSLGPQHPTTRSLQQNLDQMAGHRGR